MIFLTLPCFALSQHQHARVIAFALNFTGRTLKPQDLRVSFHGSSRRIPARAFPETSPGEVTFPGPVYQPTRGGQCEHCDVKGRDTGMRSEAKRGFDRQWSTKRKGPDGSSD